MSAFEAGFIGLRMKVRGLVSIQLSHIGKCFIQRKKKKSKEGGDEILIVFL